MEYRKLPCGGEKISVIGMGASVVGEQELYRRCEKEGVAISAMKPFCAGQLLDARKSPFQKALTPAQCIQYALDKPGVVTVLGGPGNIAQLEESLQYLDASEEERDYSIISEITPEESVGKCGHCNSRCPFQVKQQERMEEIKVYFGM